MLFDPIDTWKKTYLEGGTYEMRELLVPIFRNGTCIYETPKLMDIQAYCKSELDTLWPETKRLTNPHRVYVDLSQKLFDMKNRLLNEAHDPRFYNKK